MAGRKRRRSAFDNDDNDRATDLPKIFIPSSVASTSKRKDTTATSTANHVPAKRTTESSPPRNKPKSRSAARRLSTIETATSTRPPAVKGRVTRASSVSVPDTPLWYLTSSGVPARLAKGIHPDVSSEAQYVYPHLATKEALDLAKPLRKERRGTGKSNLSRSTLRKTGRPSRVIHSEDEITKTALMQQWANLRMSQGTLLSATTLNRVWDTTHVSNSCNNQGPPSDRHSEVENPSCEVEPLDSIPANDYIEPTFPRPSVSSSDPATEPILELNVTHETVSTPVLGFASSAPSERFPLLEGLRHPISSPEIDQPVIDDIAPSQHADIGIVGTIAHASPHSTICGFSEPASQPPHPVASDGAVMSLQPPITSIISELGISPKSTEPEDSQSRVSLSAVEIQPLISGKADVESAIFDFHMLDLHEILSPWVPVLPTALSVYVPPAVHDLIAGMKHQLETESQARRRIERLYLEEVRKRVKMEEVVDGLHEKKIRTQKQKDSSLHVYVSNANANAAGQQHGEARTDATHLEVTKEASSA